MDDRELLIKLGIQTDNGNSGFVSPKSMGMVWFTDKQLKEVAKMLGTKAAKMTKDEIDNELLNSSVK
jgi:hypothetical protein